MSSIANYWFKSVIDSINNQESEREEIIPRIQVFLERGGNITQPNSKGQSIYTLIKSNKLREAMQVIANIWVNVEPNILVRVDSYMRIKRAIETIKAKDIGLRLIQKISQGNHFVKIIYNTEQRESVCTLENEKNAAIFGLGTTYEITIGMVRMVDNQIVDDFFILLAKDLVHAYKSSYGILNKDGSESIDDYFRSIKEELPNQPTITINAIRAEHGISPKFTSLTDRVIALVEIPRSLLHEANKTVARFILDYNGIFECNCEPGYHRESKSSHIPDCRDLIEQEVIRNIKNKHSKIQTINICSILSAGCFGELVLHTKLTALGYKVNWTLFDLKYQTKDGEETISHFKSLATQISPTTKITPHTNVLGLARDLAQDQIKPDVFLAIDLGSFGDTLANITSLDKEFDKLTHSYFKIYSSKKCLNIEKKYALISEEGDSNTIGDQPYRPIAEIQYFDKGKMLQKKMMLGTEIWDIRNYEPDSLEKMDAMRECK